ncbi:MAG: type I-MYXAN CRISPR-associated protein Cas5/Cmx5/DevS [Planctomycetaceae bacterium]|nr:type I-MYXAN CRISPR-associated protein Cas5/Cmx5/DevS [Planctomycetaceae bacterium]
MISLYLEAPFAACRTFTAGWYRPTAPYLTPSAVYGLLLNVAQVESRLREEDDRHDGSAAATLMMPGLPEAELAIGVPEVQVRGGRAGTPIPAECLFPRVHSTFQQLHNYPVGASGKDRAAACKGNKYNITPVRREYLSNVRAVVNLRGNDELQQRVLEGLSGKLNSGRYGVPFLGDNSFLPDRMEPLKEPVPVRWYERVTTSAVGIQDHAARLTISIDRADLSKTSSALFAPAEIGKCKPEESAWLKVGG